jgi:transcriptional regulator with XRE-family HTH domain
MDKVIEIYNRSELSISKFAKILQKDRRTVSSWINKEVNVDPKEDVLNNICSFFRYPNDIWSEECQDDQFVKAISQAPTKDIKLIEENRLNRLKYILKKESQGRLVIHPKFPGPVYRDAVEATNYKIQENEEVEKYKAIRIEQMLSYSYKSTEWYDIKSLLQFCFSDIGSFYTKEEKINILDLMYNTFHDNYNKQLFFYDSFSKKIFGIDTIYTSVEVQEGTMFFKSPLESIFIEINNKEIVDKIHNYFTSGKFAPSHIKPHDATKILKILKDALVMNLTVFDTYHIINDSTSYGELIKNNISVSSRHKL